MRGLYAELPRNLATRTRPEGGALASVVERFTGNAHKAAKAEGCGVEEMVQRRLASLEDLVSGFDFTTVLTRWRRASEEGSEAGKAAALRWLRAVYSTRTDARHALGVRDIIDDASFYDCLKLPAKFVVIAGYDGLLVVLDEMAHLYKLTSARSGSTIRTWRTRCWCAPSPANGWTRRHWRRSPPRSWAVCRCYKASRNGSTPRVRSRE